MAAAATSGATANDRVDNFLDIIRGVTAAPLASAPGGVYPDRGPRVVHTRVTIVPGVGHVDWPFDRQGSKRSSRR